MVLMLLLASCASSYQAALHFDPQEPLRVAVLPFATVAEDGSFMEENPSLLLDKVSVVSTELRESPASFLGRLVTQELQRTGLDIIAPAFVDAQLSHNGFYQKPPFPGAIPFDVRRVFDENPQRLCNDILFCDALLYGKVTRWVRGYYGIHSASEVGLEVTLVSARDNKILFTSRGKDGESRGIFKIPTGISSLFLEPIKGLDSDIITDLSRSMVRKMLAKLHPREVGSDQGDPNNVAPLPIILAATSDAPDSGVLSSATPLTILALGSARMIATFSIENVASEVPMEEVDDGHYIGKYTALREDSFPPSQIKVSLTDNLGRTITRPIPSPLVTLEAGR